MEAYVKRTITNIMKYLERNQGPGMSSLNEITPNIYCSDYDTACNAEMLNDNRIYTVISLGNEKSKAVLAAYKKRKITNIQYSIEDDPRQSLAEVFFETYDIILNTVGDGRKILIHCNAGVSRAPSVIIAYLLHRQYLISYHKYRAQMETTDIRDEIRYQKLQDLCRLDDSKLLGIIKFIKRVRPCISPNPGFIQQLFLFERYLKGHIMEELQTIMQRDNDEIKKRKREKLKNGESDSESESEPEPEEETPKPAPKKKSIMKSKPVSTTVDYTGRDLLEDLERLENSDDEPDPLEVVPPGPLVIVATGDMIDNSDVIDALDTTGLEADPKSDAGLESNSGLDSIVDSEPIPDGKFDDFDLDF